MYIPTNILYNTHIFSFNLCIFILHVKDKERSLERFINSSKVAELGSKEGGK